MPPCTYPRNALVEACKVGTVLLIEDGLMEVKVTESPGSIQEATGRTVVRSYACGPAEEVFGFAKRGLRLPKGSTKRLKLIRAYLPSRELEGWPQTRS